MNHDATHCSDYLKDACPKDCHLAQLTQELKDRVDLLWLPVLWCDFYTQKSELCMRRADGKELK